MPTYNKVIYVKEGDGKGEGGDLIPTNMSTLKSSMLSDGIVAGLVTV